MFLAFTEFIRRIPYLREQYLSKNLPLPAYIYVVETPLHLPPRQVTQRKISRRGILVLLGGISLICGLNAALLLLGVWAPFSKPVSLGAMHGSLMVFGFLGTLISLERAQALAEKRRIWPYLAPFLLGFGAILLAFSPLFPASLVAAAIARILIAEGAFAFLAVCIGLYLRAPHMLLAAQILSSVAFAAASLLVFVASFENIVPLLSAYILITIGAERAELAQLTMGKRAIPTLMVFSSVFLLV